MKIMKSIVLCVSIALTATTFGCASTRTHEASGQYVDDSVITTKVKAAIVGESTLKVSEINVETFKGVVQLSGFVSKADNIPTAPCSAGRRCHLGEKLPDRQALKANLQYLIDQPAPTLFAPVAQSEGPFSQY
jgi:hypothetical protein